MRIEDEVKIDFKDVLIRPKRSKLNSRSEVDLNRTFTFKHSKKTWTGVPIMASNMDGVGTFAMAKALQNHNMFTCLVKSYEKDDWIANGNDLDIEYFAVSTGTSQKDLDKLRISRIVSHPHFICVDVANGYSEHFGDFVAKIRDLHPSCTIIAGNVVTADMTQELILRGADIVKVGIGPGCWLPGELVNTNRGFLPIEEVEIGDEVKTHKNRWRKVIDVLSYNNDKPIISINGMKSTSNHEYYVLHKKHKDVVSDNNLEEYAEWISAENLTKDYLLLKQRDK